MDGSKAVGSTSSVRHPHNLFYLEKEERSVEDQEQYIESYVAGSVTSSKFQRLRLSSFGIGVGEVVRCKWTEA